jgi:hypothetical protein
MAGHFGFGATSLRIAGCGRMCGGFTWRLGRIILRRRLGRIFLRRNARQLFERSGNSAQRAEVRQIDHGGEQADHPEQVVVREQRQHAQHGYDFKLELLRLVGHPLRQRVQVQSYRPREQRRSENADRDHQDVGVTRSGDEAWQMMRGAWMKCLAHVVLHLMCRRASGTLNLLQQPLICINVGSSVRGP